MPDDILKRLQIQQQQAFDDWLRDTRCGSWLMYPVWAVGWWAGLCVRIAQGLWWNVVRGYKRQTTHWVKHD